MKLEARYSITICVQDRRDECNWLLRCLAMTVCCQLAVLAFDGGRSWLAFIFGASFLITNAWKRRSLFPEASSEVTSTSLPRLWFSIFFYILSIFPEFYQEMTSMLNRSRCQLNFLFNQLLTPCIIYYLCSSLLRFQWLGSNIKSS